MMKHTNAVRLAAVAALLLLLGACSKRRETAAREDAAAASPSSSSITALPTAADAAFWQWFVSKKDVVATVKRADEPIANELAAQLHKVDKDLTFELGIATNEHELIISADGIKTVFPAVKRLAAGGRRCGSRVPCFHMAL